MNMTDNLGDGLAEYPALQRGHSIDVLSGERKSVLLRSQTMISNDRILLLTVSSSTVQSYDVMRNDIGYGRK